MTRRRKPESPEAIRARVLDFARVMNYSADEADRRANMAAMSVDTWDGIAKLYEDSRAQATNRGDRWSDTYHARRARERAQEARSEREAWQEYRDGLSALWTTSCPAGEIA